MAVVDSYLNHWSGAGLNPLVRRRRRFADTLSFLVPSTGSTIYSFNCGTRQDTVDHKSTGWYQARKLDRRNKTPRGERLIDRFDYGGDFYSRTVSLPPPSNGVAMTARVAENRTYRYSGPMLAHGNAYELYRDFLKPTFQQSAGSGDVSVPTHADLFAYGAAGIAETLPNVPSASLALSLGELREGLPRVIGAQTASQGDLGSVGGEYLNYTFGIKPIIQDIQDYVQMSKDYDDFVRFWSRSKGRTIRRNRVLEDTSKVTSTDLGNSFPWPGDQGTLWWSSGPRALHRKVENRVWFSASYRVEAPPPGENAFRELKEFTDAFGVVPDVSTVWNLYPWTWLLGWVIDVDSLITNLSFLGKKGVNLHYAYVMAETSVQDYWTGSFGVRTLYDYQIFPSPSHQTVAIRTDGLRTVTKQRRRASPLGFGVTFDGLSSSQKAILAALGISRTRF